MALSIYSTLSRTQAPFAPIEPNHVRMYVCGVTVYDYCHIGHGRTFVAFDVVRRWLQASGMKVTFVRHLTGVYANIIRRAAERGITTTELTEEFGRAMQEDMLALGCLAPTHEPRATDYIPEMLGLIEKLEQKGYAYQGSDGDVDFAVRKFRQVDRRPAVGRPRRRGCRQARSARLRALEERQAGRAPVGIQVGLRPSGLAHRVLGHERQDPRRHVRHPRRRSRPHLPAP